MSVYYDADATVYLDSVFDGFAELQKPVWLSLFKDDPVVQALPDHLPLSYLRDMFPAYFERDVLLDAFIRKFWVYRRKWESEHDGQWRYAGRRSVYLLVDYHMHESTSLMHRVYNYLEAGPWGSRRYEELHYRYVEQVMGVDEVAPTRQMKIVFAWSTMIAWLTGAADFRGRDLQPFTGFWLTLVADL